MLLVNVMKVPKSIFSKNKSIQIKGALDCWFSNCILYAVISFIGAILLAYIMHSLFEKISRCSNVFFNELLIPYNIH